MAGGQPLKWKSPEELENKIQEYYKWAKENKKHITVTGLAWWLGCSRTTLMHYEKAEESEWLNRCNDEEKRKYVNSIKNAKRFIEMNYEDSLFNKSSTAGAIFTLKNNYGWVDKQEITTNNDNNINISLEDE
ncbi:terminase small subunit [Clostridium sp. K25]|uniref:terminase small subunit n=1 Tax=Clostridium sp. K25 TaxID=1443109 RepID=UPI0004D62957|nr:terminase small subunit [Clostridium sp. K25]KEI06201.1 phage terminase, large subunit, PBSX family [Clostridium sp. K25]